ncbi:MAG: DUF177 domain-containing protein [Rhizobiaceae bacterium]
MTHEIEKLAFAYPFNVRRLARKGQHIRFAADPDICARIARDYDLIEVKLFEVECKITPWKSDGVALSGSIRADVIQPCAVSAEPLRQKVEEEIDFIFLPEGSRLVRPPRFEEQEMILDPTGDDIPDTFMGDSLDLAGPWLETFVLGIDPFARIEGVEFSSDKLDSERESPFAALAALKSETKNV